MCGERSFDRLRIRERGGYNPSTTFLHFPTKTPSVVIPETRSVIRDDTERAEHPALVVRRTARFAGLLTMSALSKSCGLSRRSS
jgi:hypothetical protein